MNVSEHLCPHFCTLPTHNTQYFKLTGRRKEVVTRSNGEQNKSVHKLHSIICHVLKVVVVQNDGRVSGIKNCKKLNVPTFRRKALPSYSVTLKTKAVCCFETSEHFG